MEGPGGEPISLAGGVWEGRPALVSAPLSQPGIYSLQGTGLVRPKKFAVTLETEESGLQRDVPPVVMEKLGLSSLPIFHEEQSIRRALQPAARRSVELWRLAILGALALLFLESWLTRRQAQPALASSAAAAPDSGVRQHL